MLRRTPRNGTSVTIKGKFYEVFANKDAFTAASKTIGHEYLIHVSDPGFQPMYHLVGYFDPTRRQWMTKQAPIGSGYIHEPSGHLWVAVDNGWQDVGNIKGEKGDPGERGPQGPAGPEGPQIILRTSEWSAGVEYHNDKDSSAWPRFQDQVIVTQPVGSAIPFEVYICKQTHVSSSAAELKNSGLWQRMNQMAPIYTPLIIAQNAYLKFSQTNQLLVTDNNKVIAGMGGGDYPLWLGGDSPMSPSTNFRVSKDGTLETNNARLGGYLYQRFVSIEESDAEHIGSGTQNEEYLLKNNLYIDATHSGVVLPIGEKYEGARIVIVDSNFLPSRVPMPPTTIRTSNGTPIVSGIFSAANKNPMDVVYAAKDMTIDCGTVEFVAIKAVIDGVRKNAWLLVGNTCRQISWTDPNGRTFRLPQ